MVRGVELRVEMGGGVLICRSGRFLEGDIT